MTATIPSIALLMSFTVFLCVESAPNCRLNVAQASDASCTYGAVKDWCNRNVCGKGPGQPCGGQWMQYGNCGSGMYCNCGKCTGCAHRTMECHNGKVC